MREEAEDAFSSSKGCLALRWRPRGHRLPSDVSRIDHSSCSSVGLASVSLIRAYRESVGIAENRDAVSFEE
jgi:hypothetical protein